MAAATQLFRSVDGDRAGIARIVGILLIAMLGLSVLASLSIGPFTIPFLDVWSVLFQQLHGEGANSIHTVVVMDIRIPRTLLGILVGATLAVSGAVMQSLFRNPLADPGLVGISSGAALAAVSVIVLGIPGFLLSMPLLANSALPIAAFLGGFLSTCVLYMISTRQGQTSTATMLLAGIAMAAIANAGTGILIYVSDDQQLRELNFWMLGSLAGATWPRVLAIIPFILPTLLVAVFLARGLNGLLLGENEAMHIGINVQQTKALAIVLVALGVGAAVSVSGIIGFVGIVVPHVLRLVVGPDNRYLLPASALLGGALLVCADVVARTIVAPAELPIGIVTAILGGPFFLWLLLRQRALIDV